MNASQLPMDFHAFCDEPQSREDYTNTERTIFYVESERGLERASRIMDAKLAQHQDKKARSPPLSQSFTLAVEDTSSGGATAQGAGPDGNTKSELRRRADSLAAQMSEKISREITVDVASAQSLEDGELLQGWAGSARVRPGTKAPTDMRFAYSIFYSPNDSSWRIYRLMKLLHNLDDFFFIHVDSFVHFDESSHTEAFALDQSASEALVLPPPLNSQPQTPTPTPKH
jgi:hypothetical protein